MTKVVNPMNHHPHPPNNMHLRHSGVKVEGLMSLKKHPSQLVGKIGNDISSSPSSLGPRQIYHLFKPIANRNELQVVVRTLFLRFDRFGRKKTSIPVTGSTPCCSINRPGSRSRQRRLSQKSAIPLTQSIPCCSTNSLDSRFPRRRRSQKSIN